NEGSSPQIEGPGLQAAPAVPGTGTAARPSTGGRSTIGEPMQSHPPTSIESYKTLARTWAATVTVVTARRASTREPAAEAAPTLDGFTATAFFTVSMAPPIIV